MAKLYEVLQVKDHPVGMVLLRYGKTQMVIPARSRMAGTFFSAPVFDELEQEIR